MTNLFFLDWQDWSIAFRALSKILFNLGIALCLHSAAWYSFYALFVNGKVDIEKEKDYMRKFDKCEMYFSIICSILFTCLWVVDGF